MRESFSMPLHGHQGVRHARANFRALFGSYGTYSEYKQHAASLPALSPIALIKLKQLSLVSLAAMTKVFDTVSSSHSLQKGMARPRGAMRLCRFFHTSSY